MHDLLKCNADLHTCSGRYSALNLVCPRYNRISEGGRTFSVSATRLWNFLPTDLEKGTCVTSFRKAINSHFLTRYNDVDHTMTMTHDTMTMTDDTMKLTVLAKLKRFE